MPSAPAPSGDSPRPGSWWNSAAIYQLYVRSFADGNGDGIGDLAGVRARLPHLAALGIDAIWFNPWYPSPMADAGYDIADYRSIDPVFGTLAEADALIAEAHAHKIKIIIDVVPNHSSNRHPWFAEALVAAPGSAARGRFWFRPGRGAHGELPPNNWQSIFGGPAWTRVTEADGSPGEWYLHLFAPEQPDFNWDSAEVRREFEDVLRFWFARGVDGIRIDSAALLCKDAALPDLAGTMMAGTGQPGPPAHPYIDRDEVHAIYQSWRAIADSYRAMLIGEIWLPDSARLARYVGPGELHTVFNFPYLNCPWDAAELRRVIDETLALNAPLGVPATWVLSNHDVDRVVSRYGRPDTSFSLERRPYFHGLPVDLTLGTRRARAAALLTMALPGSVYIYQGEEMGLGEVQDIPDELRQDPIWDRTGGADPGRDGSRVPLPWSGTEPPFGFSPAGATAEPWLPQPKEWRELTVSAQSADGDSMLSLYQAALRIRRTAAVFATAPLSWRQAPDGVLAFDRPAGHATVRCVANLSAAPVGLPLHASVLLASGPLDDGLLPPDTTAWLSAPERLGPWCRGRVGRLGGLRGDVSRAEVGNAEGQRVAVTGDGHVLVRGETAVEQPG
jgi:alpha-glucosidase